jgi:hypothetical protein
MAVFDFKCKSCDQILENVVLGMNHEDDDHPACYQCGEHMEHYFTSAPMAICEAELQDGGFIAHSVPDRPLITSRRQNRELMKRHGLTNAMDYYRPPTHKEQQATRAEMRESINSITPDTKQQEELKRVGLSDIV